MSDNVDSHDDYQPNEVTTVPITQDYDADNASTSNNANTATSDVQADSVAHGAQYGSVDYKPDLSSQGVSLVLSPNVTKLGTAQGGVTSATSYVPYVIGAVIVGIAIVWLFSKGRQKYVRY